MDGWMDGRTDGRTDGWMDGWMNGRMDGWMDGWTNGSLVHCYLVFLSFLLFFFPSCRMQAAHHFVKSGLVGGQYDTQSSRPSAWQPSATASTHSICPAVVSLFRTVRHRFYAKLEGNNLVCPESRVSSMFLLFQTFGPDLCRSKSTKSEEPPRWFKSRSLNLRSLLKTSKAFGYNLDKPDKNMKKQ